MAYSLGLILIFMLLATLAGAFTGWLAATVRRPRVRDLQADLAMHAARLQSAESNASAASERLWAVKRDAEQLADRLRARIEAQDADAELRNATIARLEGEVAALSRRGTDEARSLRDALAQARNETAALREARSGLMRGCETLLARKKDELMTLHAQLGDRERRIALLETQLEAQLTGAIPVPRDLPLTGRTRSGPAEFLRRIAAST